MPFATVGGVFALYLTHTVLSVSAAVGFITLFGVAVMDGVLLIIYVRQAREHTPGNQEAILEAVSQRLRPVLMTALLASLGLLPAAMSHAIGSDTQRPFAIVIIGGLISVDAADDAAAADPLRARRPLVRDRTARAAPGAGGGNDAERAQPGIAAAGRAKKRLAKGPPADGRCFQCRWSHLEEMGFGR